jgi:hypothetical protein
LAGSLIWRWRTSVMCVAEHNQEAITALLLRCDLPVPTLLVG